MRDESPGFITLPHTRQGLFTHASILNQKCMLIELKNKGLIAEDQKPIKVFYDVHVVGDFIADILVNDTIIVELKSVRRIVRAHEIKFSTWKRNDSILSL